MLELALTLSTLANAPAPATAPATMPEPTWPQILAFLACVGTVAIGATLAAYFLGAWRRSVQGPPRIAPDASVWPIILALVAAFAGLFVGGSVAAVFIRIVDGRELLDVILRPPSAVDGDTEVAGQIIIRRMQISAASYVFAMAAALLALWIARVAGWRGGIGARLANLPRGVLYGLLAGLLVIPWMMTVSVLFQAVLKALDVQVEAMHELIRAIRDHPQKDLIAWGLFSATILAPLAEEVLFRGVLQTALVTAWARIFEPQAPVVTPASSLAVAPNLAAPVSGFTSPAPALTSLDQPALAAIPPHGLGYWPSPAPPPTPARFGPSGLARWVGIVLTSVVFAILHETWSIPLIFVLSLALGYLYERTGNLWTCIAVHFAFNAFNMLLILPFLL